MELDKVKILLNSFLISVFVLLAVSYSTYSRITMILSFVLLIAFILLWFLLWRCPHCSEHLGRTDSCKYCKHCGKELYK